jgi:acetylornithine deacetylase
VIGEEVDGAGAHFANQSPPDGVRYLINGEPTSNLLALGSKGTLRLDLRAKGKNAHSAYPELADSAIDKILDNVQALRNLELPVDEVLGACTMNVGVIRGGRAANIIADECTAEIAIRVVTDLQETKKLFLDALDDRVEATIVTETPAVLLKAVEGFETTIVKYTTDIPKLSNWGQPLLLGPGTIHVAHTLEERVPKKEVAEAVDLYASLVKQLKTTKD